MRHEDMQNLIAKHTQTHPDAWQSFNCREFDALRCEGMLFYNWDMLDCVLVAPHPQTGVWSVMYSHYRPEADDEANFD
jgi:hypothetical protein